MKSRVNLYAFISALHVALLMILLASSPAGSGSITLLGAGKPAAGGGGNDPATTAWVAAAGGSPAHVSAGRVTVVNTFITCLKSASLWTTIDRYWLLAGEDQTSASVDMKGLVSLTVVNAPTFTANKGYTPSSTKYLDTGFVPSTAGGNYTQNSATSGMFVNTTRGATSNEPNYGAANGAFTNIVNFNVFGFAGPAVDYRLNTSGDVLTGTATTARGAHLITRNGSSTVAPAYYNGASFDTLTSATTGLPDVSVYLGALNQGGAPAAYGIDQMSDFVIGGGWSSGQVSSFYSCQSAMMTSIGVLP